METIQLNAYEKKDLIEYLKYAKEQKELNRKKVVVTSRQTKKFNTTDYDIQRIDYLLDIIGYSRERISLKK